MFVYKVVDVQILKMFYILQMFDVQNCIIMLPYYGLPS